MKKFHQKFDRLFLKQSRKNSDVILKILLCAACKRKCNRYEKLFASKYQFKTFRKAIQKMLLEFILFCDFYVEKFEKIKS